MALLRPITQCFITFYVNKADLGQTGVYMPLSQLTLYIYLLYIPKNKPVLPLVGIAMR